MRTILILLLLLSFSNFSFAANDEQNVSDLNTKLFFNDLKPFRIGGFAGIGSPPFPSIIGINPNIELYECVKIYVGLDIYKFSQWFYNLKAAEMTGGYGLILKYPFFEIQPVLGLQFTRNIIAGSPKRYYGDLETNATFFNISVGAEKLITNDFFVGLGLNIPHIKREGENKSHFVSGFYPYLHIGAYIF